jgi:hypothetical protein
MNRRIFSKDSKILSSEGDAERPGSLMIEGYPTWNQFVRLLPHELDKECSNVHFL